MSDIHENYPQNAKITLLGPTKCRDLRAFLGVKSGLTILVRVKDLTFCNSDQECGAVDKCFCLFFSQAALPYFLSETGICVQSGKHTLAESSQDDLYCLQVSNQCTSDFRKMCLTDKKCVDQIKLEGSKRQPRIRIARTHQYEYRPLE